MKLKDETRSLGRLGLLFPLLLILLITADPAFACPGHKTTAAYRTKTINTRTVSGIPTTVITYRGPASQRCGNNVVVNRNTRYVAVRGDAYDNGTRYVPIQRSNVRYVAVSDNGRVYTPKTKRYVAVRNSEVYTAPRRTVVVPDRGYVDDEGTRYVAVSREGSRVMYAPVREVEVERRYVAVRNTPVYNTVPRYAAVRTVNSSYDAAPARYVAVRNAGSGCAREVALRSCLGQAEAMSAKHVVVRTDELDGTRQVIIPNRSADVEYAAYPAENISRTRYVAYNDAAYSGGETYVMANDTEPIYTERIDRAPIEYYDRQIEDQAILGNAGTTYVAADDIVDACLKPVAYSPYEMAATRTVSYVPVDDIENDAVLNRAGPRYVMTGNFAPHSIPYVALDEDRVFDDVDPAFVAANGLDNARMETASYIPAGDIEALDAETVSYVPVDEMDTVSYVPVRHTAVTNVSYVPVEDRDVTYVEVENAAAEPVRYVPVNNMDTQYIAADDCPLMVSSVQAEPFYVSGNSTIFVEEVGDTSAVVLSGTQRIAAQYGYHDGFNDGLNAAKDGDAFLPTKEGDYRNATEGYDDEFGSKDVYKSAYRDSYLRGYDAGFKSVIGTA